MLSEAEVLRWFYEIARERQRQHQPNVVHVSEVCGCLRRAWYDRKYGLVEAHPRFVIYALGNGVHEALQKHLNRKGWQVEVPCLISLKDFRLVGHADAFNPDDNIVLEFKTASKLPERPYRQHVMQLNAYIHMLRAKAGYVIYLDKRSGRVAVHRLHWSPQLWQELVERAKLLHTAIVGNRPPRREPGPLCEFCAFRLRCSLEGGERSQCAR